MLEASRLCKSFGGRAAVDEASFRVGRGSITSLIGPNGAGKTTVFNLFSGVLAPDSGSVFFDDTEVTGWLPHRIMGRGMARTFQITRAIPDMTVLENLVLSATQPGWRWLSAPRISRSERERAGDILSLLGIADLAHDDAANLSYGQQKLLELGSAMMSRPSLMLLDEPAGGVNPALLEVLISHILKLNEQGTSFLIVEHNVNLVMSISDSVVVMAHGAVLMQGSPEEVQADETVLNAYLGTV